MLIYIKSQKKKSEVICMQNILLKPNRNITLGAEFKSHQQTHTSQ